MARLSAEALDELAEFARAGRIGAEVPFIHWLSVTPKIFVGEVATVRWSVEGASDVGLRINGADIARVIPVAAAGELALPALSHGRYQLELLASNEHSVATRSVTVMVAWAPPTLQSQISHAVFEFGAAPLRLSWQTQRTEQVRIEFDGRVTMHPAQGETEIFPRRAGRYAIRVTALGAGGTVSVCHRIRAIVPPVRITLRVPEMVGYGLPARITWTVSGARAITLAVNLVPACGALGIDVIDRGIHLLLSATGHDGTKQERRARLVPSLLEQIAAPTDLSALTAPLPLSAILGHG